MGLFNRLKKAITFTSNEEVSLNNPKFENFSEKEDGKITLDNASERLSVINQTIGSGTTDQFIQFIYGAVDTNKKTRLKYYRNISNYSELGDAIEDICDNALNFNENGECVNLKINNNSINKLTRKEIENSFNFFISLFEFDINMFDYMKKLVIEGEICWENIISDNKKELGIIGINELDNDYYEYCYNIKTNRKLGIVYSDDSNEVINNHTHHTGFKTTNLSHSESLNDNKAVLLPWEQITYVDTGSYSNDRKIVYPILERARKAFNQLTLIEDSIIIYRLARAPERLVFNIDVGDMPRSKAEQKVRQFAQRFKQKKIYDANNNTVTNGYDPNSICENFFFPKSDGGGGTDVESLAGACLSLDTMIPLLDGRTLSLIDIIKEHKEGKQLWAYSCNPKTGEFVPGKIDMAEITRKNAKVLKLTLDNGETITCTPDHKFPTWNGKKRADELKVDDSLISFNKNNIDKLIRISSIEYLDETIDTGTLTIDSEHKYHNYHTFALSSGVYTFNSNLGEIEDVDYFLKKLYRSLKVPFSARRKESGEKDVRKGEDTSWEEFKFHKFTVRILNRFEQGIKSSFIKHLKLKGVWEGGKLNSNDIKIKFTAPLQYELELSKLAFQRKMENYGEIADREEFSNEMAMKEILGWSEEKIKENRDKVKEEKRQEAIIEFENSNIDDSGKPSKAEEQSRY